MVRRIDHVFNLVTQIEENVRVNRDERPLALARNHNRAACPRLEGPAAVHRSLVAPGAELSRLHRPGRLLPASRFAHFHHSSYLTTLTCGNGRQR